MIVADAVTRTVRKPGPAEVVTVRPALRTGYGTRVGRSSILLSRVRARPALAGIRSTIHNIQRPQRLKE